MAHALGRRVLVLSVTAGRIDLVGVAERGAVLLVVDGASGEEALARASAGDVRGALRVARAALREGDDPQAQLALGWALILAGRGEDGYALFRRHLGAAPRAVPPLGQVATWMEDYETARAEPGDGTLEFRTGDWDVARARAAGSTLALLDAVTGNPAAARATLESDQGLPRQAGLGLLELSLGNTARALEHLEQARQLVRRTGLREPNVVQWAPDLIETQVRLGRTDEAQRSLEAFDRVARATRRRWALAMAQRCRGLLVGAAEVDATFERAERLARVVPAPFDDARTQLCWGERLRRDSRRLEARRRLGEALARFDALGATPWAERAAAELRASGARARRGPQARGNELTAQEVRVARLTCEGLTNKDIAARLFVSPRTVETHLAHVFRKLDVRTRTELAHVLGERARGDATASSSTT